MGQISQDTRFEHSPDCCNVTNTSQDTEILKNPLVDEFVGKLQYRQMSLFGCELYPPGSCACIFTPQLVLLSGGLWNLCNCGLSERGPLGVGPEVDPTHGLAWALYTSWLTNMTANCTANVRHQGWRHFRHHGFHIIGAEGPLLPEDVSVTAMRKLRQTDRYDW